MANTPTNNRTATPRTGKTRHASKTNRRTVEASALAIECHRLRIAGLNYREIGKKLNCSHVTAYKHVKQILDEQLEETKELSRQILRMQHERHEKLIMAYFSDAMHGNDKAAGVVTRNLEALSRLYGLEKHTVSGDPDAPLQLTLADIAAEAIRDKTNERN